MVLKKTSLQEGLKTKLVTKCNTSYATTHGNIWDIKGWDQEVQLYLHLGDLANEVIPGRNLILKYKS